jgi:drug/metabolite transporter (DMT)-like permease
MNNKLFDWIIFILLCIIWGSSFKLMKDSTTALSATQIAALRIFAAGLVFVPFAFFHFNKIPKDKLGPVVLSAVFGNLLPAFLFAAALTKLDGSLGGILNSLTPLFVVIVGILFFQVKIEMQKIWGVVIGLIGLVLLILLPSLLVEKNISFNNLGYTLLILLATFLYGINVNMVGKYLKGLSPVHAATVSLAFMVIPTTVILVVNGFFKTDFTQPGVTKAIIYVSLLGVLGSAVATVLFYILVKRAGGLFASLVTYGIPFIALIWGVADGEKVTWLEFICLGIILLGVYLANKTTAKQVS